MSMFDRTRRGKAGSGGNPAGDASAKLAPGKRTRVQAAERRGKPKQARPGKNGVQNGPGRDLMDDAPSRPSRSELQTGGVLGPEEVEHARRNNPIYQRQLGFDPTEFSAAPVDSAEFAQDVARYQEEHTLIVDGMAGPTTCRKADIAESNEAGAEDFAEDGAGAGESAAPETERAQAAEHEAEEETEEEMETVYVLDENGEHVELPRNEAGLLFSQLRSQIWQNRGGIATALSIYEGLEEQSGVRQWYAEKRSGAETPDIAAGEQALSDFDEAIEAITITERYDNLFMNLERGKHYHERAIDPAERVANQIWRYRDDVIEGAEKGASDAEFIRNVSFTAVAGMATAGVGAKASAAGWGTTKVAAAKAGTAGAFAAGEEIIDYTSTALADPTKEFDIRELGANALKEFLIGAVMEVAGSALRDKLRMRMTGVDDGWILRVIDSYDSEVHGLMARSAKLGAESLKQLLIEIIADVPVRILESFIETFYDAVWSLIAGQSSISLDGVLEHLSEELWNWSALWNTLARAFKELYEEGAEDLTADAIEDAAVRYLSESVS